MASGLESVRLSSSPSWLFCQSCSTVPNPMPIPDLCHQHLLGAPYDPPPVGGTPGSYVVPGQAPGGGCGSQKSRANQSYYSN